MKQMQPLTESQLQIQIFEWAQLMTGKYPELSLLYHIPNEGKRSIYYGAKLKREGLKSGVPDICLPIPKGQYGGLYIELKVGFFLYRKRDIVLPYAIPVSKSKKKF